MTNSHKKLNIAIIGIGRWGKNLLREFDKIFRVSLCMDKGNPTNEQWLKKNYPHIKMVRSLDTILQDPSIEAVVIATPIHTHAEIAKKALLAGKHVFVEKPITKNVREATELVTLAKKHHRILFVGHIFSYHPVFQKIRKLILHDPVRYAQFSWEKMGTFEEDFIWNHAPHDIGLALELFGMPSKIKLISKQSILTETDIADFKLKFSRGRSCDIYFNRISNLKRKAVLLVTQKNVYLWDDYALYKLNKKTRLFHLYFRTKISALELECCAFLSTLQNQSAPRTDGNYGLQVVKIISRLHH